MSRSVRLWKASSGAGFAVPVAPNYGQLGRNGFDDLHKKLLASKWDMVDLEWHRQRSSDRPSQICTLYLPTALCFPTSVSQRLIRAPHTCIELLPLRLGNENWSLLNCPRDAMHLVRESSDLWIQSLSELAPSLPEYADVKPWIADVRWVNVVEPRALDEGWETICVPASSDAHAHRHFLVTDHFVERVQEAGLRGLDFKHVGYIVADASQAVPKPAEPPKPPAPPSKRREPKFTTLPLPAEEQIELARAAADWRKRMQLSADTAAGAVLTRLASELEAVGPTYWTISADERMDATLGLSAIYGELLCKHAGWKWVELRQSKAKRWIAVASADGRHALALLPYIQQQVSAQPPTLELLFNMIRAGRLPDVEAGQTKVIA